MLRILRISASPATPILSQVGAGPCCGAVAETEPPNAMSLLGGLLGQSLAKMASVRDDHFKRLGARPGAAERIEEAGEGEHAA